MPRVARVRPPMSAIPSPDVSPPVPPPEEERRRFTRYSVRSRLKVRWLHCGECHEELLGTEDVSRGGARLIVRMPLPLGEIIYIEGWDRHFQTRAEVRRVYLGRDGDPRLGIAFLDAEPPARVLFEARRSRS